MEYRSTNNFLLALTAFIWGSAFVAQSVGLEYLGPFTFNSIRSLLGGIVLLPVVWAFKRYKRKGLAKGYARDEGNGGTSDAATLVVGGLCCGLVLAVATSLQQIGLMYTTAGKAGFITALYIVMVPLLGIFLKKRVGKKVWAGVLLAVTGMYFLCITEGFSIAKGDFYVFLCAVAFSVHILVIDHFSPRVEGVDLSCVQFFVCGTVCAVPMLLMEQPSIAQLLSAWIPLAYAGVLSCGVAYTLQIIVQKKMEPTVVSLILSMEAVFSVLTGWVILGERLTFKEQVGCLLMFFAVILAQLPEKKRSR